MTNKDIIFKIVKNVGVSTPSNSFCYFGWEGTGCFAFSIYANSYFDSANALYEKIKQSSGDYRVIDGLGLAICFCYRHYVELELKYLHVKYGVKTEEGYKILLGIGHSLVKIWEETKPTIEYLHKRVGSSVDLDAIEHYIRAVHDFDSSSMSMRYPVEKNGKPMKPETRLDLPNLVNRMNELKDAFDKLDYEIDGQMLANVEDSKKQAFLGKYIELRLRLCDILEQLKPYDDSDSTDFEYKHILDITADKVNKFQQIKMVFDNCSDDELIMLNTLFYTGSFIDGNQLHLPKSQSEAKEDVVKCCVLNMESCHLEFGKSKNNTVQLLSKQVGAIIKCVNISMQYLDFIE